MKDIRHFHFGYILIFLTPVLSIGVLALMALADWNGVQNYLQPLMQLTAWNVSIIAVLAIGIAMYLYGYLKQGNKHRSKATLLFSFLLILWGALTYIIASGWYSDEISWSMNPGVRALTIWDNMQYWTWELKAILWIGTGLLLIVTSALRIVTSRSKIRTS